LLAELQHRLRAAGEWLSAHGLDSLPAACRGIPLDIFGAIQIDRPECAAALLRWLPTMPSDDTQRLWTGAAGHVLLGQSIAFVRTLPGYLPHRDGRRSEDVTILDFGCGWGRLARLVCKFIRPSRLWGVDPWDISIDACKKHGVPGTFRMSSWIPRDLDVPEDLELVYAFSVFTHLPEEVAVTALRTLTRHMARGGRLLLSIRPVEYWAIHDFSASARGYTRERAEAEHERGYAFAPHNRPPVEGIVTYGDTSMTVEYAQRLAAPLELIALEWTPVDSLQLVLVFEKR
jgi:SAM-dependent methyltransferase